MSPEPAQRPLPTLLLLTDRHQLPGRRRLTDVVAACVQAGLRAVLVRERDLEDRARAELVYDLDEVLAPVGGTLVVAAPQLGRPDGLHLRRSDRAPRSRPTLLGRSCHDRDDLARAVREGCDYVTVSPVAPSASKPGYGPALGATGLRELTRHPVLAPVGATLTVPVYALGGVGPHNAAGWLDAGADGVAVMGAVMRAADPPAVTAALLDALAHRTAATAASTPGGTGDNRLGSTG